MKNKVGYNAKFLLLRAIGGIVLYTVWEHNITDRIPQGPRHPLQNAETEFVYLSSKTIWVNIPSWAVTSQFSCSQDAIVNFFLLSVVIRVVMHTRNFLICTFKLSSSRCETLIDNLSKPLDVYLKVHIKFNSTWKRKILVNRSKLRKMLFNNDTNFF